MAREEDKKYKMMNFKSYITSRLSLLDLNTLEVVKKSSASLIVKIGGMLATFAVSIILGRTIGPEGLGIINLANRIVAIVLIFAMLGMNNVILKEVAIAFERKDWQHVANIIYTSLCINVPLALGFSIMFIFFTPWITENVFNEHALKTPLIIALAVVVPQVISRIFVSGVNGFRKIWQSNLVNDALSTGAIAIGLLILLILNIEITVINVAILYAFARLIVSFAVSIYWKHLFDFKGKLSLETRSMLKVALPLLIVTSTSMIAANADAVMLGWLSNASEVGLYSVASSLALLTTVFHLITVSTLSPKIASLYNENKKNEIQLMVKKVTTGLFFIGLFSVLFFLFGGELILQVWGERFTIAYWQLIILSIGQLFNIGTGATGVILIMTGYEKIAGHITISSAIINVVLNLLLIPVFGAFGAAIATTSTVIIENTIKVFVVKSKTGINTIPLLK